FAKRIFELRHGAREVVIRIERAAIRFLPAILAIEPVARRGGALLAGQRVASALHALFVVGGRRTTRLDADRAALRLDLHDDLGEVHADVIVLGADIGGAQILVLR